MPAINVLPPAIVTTDGWGYKYTETSDGWNAQCAGLPCFAALHWPDYDTHVLGDVIDGEPMVIQLWKGWCPRFLGLPSFPGGIGAEVGVYRRMPGRPLPQAPSFLPPPLRALVGKAFATLPADSFWWPVTDREFDIEFRLTNPVTGNLFFASGNRRTWWRNKWMFEDSYARYKQTQGRKWPVLPVWFPGNARVPAAATGYRLDYSINGKTYPSW